MSDGYYNEINLHAAQWLENLIYAGLIAPGVVDRRSIEDVTPNDIKGFKQCHFFAGIGIWSYALRASGWADDRPVWTGSCPCQPFSSAGKGAAFADERHLWPAFHHLIKERRPESIFGEQVASKDVDPWIDLVQADLEALGYAFGGVAFPSAGIGAPHIRDRTYWVADSNGMRWERLLGESKARLDQRIDDERPQLGFRLGGEVIGLGYAKGNGRKRSGQLGEQAGRHGAAHNGATERLANAELQQRPHGECSISVVNEARGREQGSTEIAGLCSDLRPGPTNGKWRYADWLGCTDGKWRPVEPGTFPLVDGDSSRVGRLRAYGNAINAEQARIFIETVMECEP